VKVFTTSSDQFMGSMS